MRSEGNPLDLNNLPEDYIRDVSGDTSSSAGGGYRKKKSGAKERKDELGKVYECRFCSLKFCKSQALGGHMNRHRQERETETLNKARQLVFTNDLGPAHLGYVSSCGQPIPHGGYHQASNNMAADFRSIYPSRMFPTSPLIPPPPPPPPPQTAAYMYPSSPHLLSFPATRPGNDYLVGHGLTNSSYGPAPNEGNFTCIGAAVGGSGWGPELGGGGVRDLSVVQKDQEEGLNWGRR